MGSKEPDGARGALAFAGAVEGHFGFHSLPKIKVVRAGSS